MTLELSGLSKRFGSIVAVDDASLELRPGQVHALIGENGAGKSTIVNMVAGLLTPDSGDIVVDGTRVRLTGRRASAAEGIGVVHQHPSMVPTMTVAENIELGNPRRTWRADLGRARRDVATWTERTGLVVHADAPVERLSMGERQRAEIVAALSWGARYLVLDEPTAVLSPFEADAMLDVIEHLAQDGLAVLLVTHKLREVERSADEVTVMRAGRVVARHQRNGFDRSSLAAEMIGDEGGGVPTVAPVAVAGSGPVRLRLEAVKAGRLSAIDLVVRAGEVVGVAGVAGNGQRELVDVASGIVRPDAGRVLIDEVDVTGNPAAAIDAGLAVLPDDRDHDALALGLAVWANVVAKRRTGIGGWRGLDRAAISELTASAIARLGVRPADHRLRVGALSGGNRQRLVIGRELRDDTSVVVAAEPTRGLDPGSAVAVLDTLARVAERGAAVLVVASDLDELLSVATRIVVLADGVVTLDVPRAEASRARVGEAMLAVAS